ncbi:PAS domain-containing protein [Pseudomonas sp. ABC1]|uniref:PAS domain-containing protein n=1 Tax=Pseudomonas sp. ABC1 TaxID=2748080 RepID=UPI0015C2F81F|nr:PAS domain-containing protein [Pseudomonas sp. ABC1]QLF93137.1 PAS domain-containing protein [Pseudomonas sp. ABC1]
MREWLKSRTLATERKEHGTHGILVSRAGGVDQQDALGMVATADGYLPQLLDVFDHTQRLQDLEGMLQLLSRVSDVAMRLRASDTQGHPPLLEEFLGALTARLGLAWSALLLEQEGRWVSVQAFGIASTLLLEERFALRLGEYAERGLAGMQRLPVEHLHEPVWGVPYQEQGRVQAWLLCAGTPGRPLAELPQALWNQVCASLAAPVLQQRREEEAQRTVARHDVLQRVFGSGWLDYQIDAGRWALAPALRDALGLCGDDGNWLERIHPADRDAFQANLDDAEQGKAFSTALRLCVEGKCRWFRIDAEVLGRGHGRRIVGFALDIQHVKEQEALASSAHARLESLIDSAPAIIYVQRYEQGGLSLEFSSASLTAVLGWRHEQLYGKSLLAFVHPEDRDTFKRGNRRLLREGKISHHYRLRDSQGHYHWMLDEVTLLRDDLGVPVETVGILLDVSEIRQTVDLLRKSEERYRALVEDSPAMICRYSPDLRLSYANRPLLDHLQRRDLSPDGLDLRDFMTAEQTEALQTRMASLSPQQPMAMLEVCMQLPGYENAWWLWAVRGSFDEQGELLEVQAVGRDDTELHKSRQLLYQSAKMATLGEMATGIAHEISQPLNVIRIALSNLIRRAEEARLTDEYLGDKLARLDEQVQRATRIVDHMRVFGRRSETDCQLFQPAKAIDGALSLVCPGLAGHGIQWNCQLDELPQVSGHPDRLEQVLINLLVNARDALVSARVATPLISIRAAVHDQHLLIEVEDNAGGVEAALMERIFEPFFTTKAVGQGTGLGLSVSYGIMQQMGGELSVSNRHDGACFTVSLPIIE